MLTQSRLKEVLHYCPNTGVFTWVTGSERRSPGDKATGLDVHGYGQVWIDKSIYKTHRLAWLYMMGNMPEHDIDHIDHDRANNIFSNLRVVTRQDNLKNMSLLNTNTSGVCGVSWAKSDRKWHSYIGHNNCRKHLGHFIDFFEAVCARKAAEVRYGYHENHGR